MPYVNPWIGLVRELVILAVCAVLVFYGKLPSEILSGVFGMILGSRATTRGIQQTATVVASSMRPPPPSDDDGEGPPPPPAPRPRMGTQP